MTIFLACFFGALIGGCIGIAIAGVLINWWEGR